MQWSCWSERFVREVNREKRDAMKSLNDCCMVYQLSPNRHETIVRIINTIQEFAHTIEDKRTPRVTVVSSRADRKRAESLVVTEAFKDL